MKRIISTIFLLGLIITQTLALCGIETKSGKIDLGGLTNGQTDYFIKRNTYPNQGWDLFINACRGVVTTVCGADVACCQQWDATSPTGHASMGKFSSVTYAALQSGAEGVVGTYTGGDGGRNMEIDFACDKNAGTGSPKFAGESPQLHYNFVWATSHACVKHGGGGGSSSKKGLSGGSIFLILVLVLVVVYFSAGIAFKKFRLHSEGRDILPNVDFWTSLPGLVIDGFKFLINKARGRGTYSQV